MLKTTIFFKNIDYLDSMLNPNRKGFSKYLRGHLNVTKAAVSTWRHGTIPYKNTLKTFATILNDLFKLKFNINLNISSEDLLKSKLPKIFNKILLNINLNNLKNIRQKYSSFNEFRNSDIWNDLKISIPEEIVIRNLKFVDGYLPSVQDYIEFVRLERLKVYSNFNEDRNFPTVRH